MRVFGERLPLLHVVLVVREAVPEEAEPLRLLLQYGVAKVTKEIDHLALRRAAEGGGGASAAADGGESSRVVARLLERLTDPACGARCSTTLSQCPAELYMRACCICRRP